MENLEQVITIVMITLGFLGLMVLAAHTLEEKADREYKKKLERRKQYGRVWRDDNNWSK